MDGANFNALVGWGIPKSVDRVLTFYGHVGVMLRALAYILSYGKKIDKLSKLAVLNTMHS
jgi:Glycine cleavage system protein P (pyridoxal-binding), C-terminal domain